jgi:prepilin-type N-terminal cleavage/methylation domain-containing protein
MKTHYHYQNRAGFTLIEVVAVLILTSLAFVFAAMLLVTSAGVFISNKEAVEDSQKIQVAMNRLVKELTYAGAGTVVVTSGRTVQWTSRHPDPDWFGVAETATWDGTSGSDLTLQGTALLDNVGVFTVSSTAGTITITLRSTRSDGVAHTTIVHPRYDL